MPRANTNPRTIFLVTTVALAIAAGGLGALIGRARRPPGEPGVGASREVPAPGAGHGTGGDDPRDVTSRGGASSVVDPRSSRGPAGAAPGGPGAAQAPRQTSAQTSALTSPQPAGWEQDAVAAERIRRAAEHLERGRARLDAGDPAAALPDLGIAAELAPSELTTRRALGLAYLALDDHLRARAELLAALDLGPTDAATLEALGKIAYAEGRLEEAISRWEAALAADPTRPEAKRLLEKARREVALEGRYRDEFTQHFRIRLESGGAAEGVSARVGDVLERAYSDVGYAIGHYPARTIAVLLYGDRDFYEVTGAHGWVGGLFDGKIRIPVKDAFVRDPAGLERVCRHEYVHACVHTLAPRCPTWLQEGLAQRFDGSTPDRALLRRAAAAGVLPAIANLGGEFTRLQDPGQVKLVYEASASFVEHLQGRSGSAGILDLLRGLGSGLALEDAISRAYGASLADLDAEWRAALAR